MSGHYENILADQNLEIVYISETSSKSFRVILFHFVFMGFKRYEQICQYTTSWPI